MSVFTDQCKNGKLCRWRSLQYTDRKITLLFPFIFVNFFIVSYKKVFFIIICFSFVIFWIWIKKKKLQERISSQCIILVAKGMLKHDHQGINWFWYTKTNLKTCRTFSLMNNICNNFIRISWALNKEKRQSIGWIGCWNFIGREIASSQLLSHVEA